MTDGRFESTYRTRGWDDRQHWAKSHICNDPAHIRDHMDRESCPFHDLRANGCFQPQEAFIGFEQGPIRPEDVVKRKGLSGFRAGGLPKHHVSRGIGGQLIPFDPEPPAERPLGSPRSSRPWATTAPKSSNGLFSKIPYMPDGRGDGAAVAASPPSTARPFKSGKVSGVPLIGAHPPHLPDAYTGKSAFGRPMFRMQAGSLSKELIPPCLPLLPAAADDRAISPRKAAKSMSPRAVYRPTTNVHGTFSAFAPHLPDPVPTGPIRSERRPILTYAAKSKRTMPIMVPWQAGTQAGVAIPPKEDLADLFESTKQVSARGQAKPVVGALLQTN